MNRHLPSRKPSEILHALKRAGNAVHHVSGSHYILKLEGRPTTRHAAVAWKRSKTKNADIDQAGFTAEEFLYLL